MLVVPPYPTDKLNNERLIKMYRKEFEEVIVFCIKKDALNMTEARINQQGVVLQGTMIPPTMFDYALRINMTTLPYVSNFVYAQGIEGVRVPLKGKGAPLKEWYSTLFNNLKKLGDTDPLPSLAQDTFGAEERWRRGQKYKDEPVEQGQNFWAGMNNQLGKERCPRCLSAVTKGLLICPFCKAEYALIQGSFAKCPPGNVADQAWRILVAGTTAPIWVPTAEGDEMGHGSRSRNKAKKKQALHSNKALHADPGNRSLHLV